MNLNPVLSGAIGVTVSFLVVALIFGEINEQNGWLIFIGAMFTTMVLSANKNPYEGRDK